MLRFPQETYFETFYCFKCVNSPSGTWQHLFPSPLLSATALIARTIKRVESYEYVIFEEHAVCFKCTTTCFCDTNRRKNSVEGEIDCHDKDQETFSIRRLRAAAFKVRMGIMEEEIVEPCMGTSERFLELCLDQRHGRWEQLLLGKFDLDQEAAGK